MTLPKDIYFSDMYRRYAVHKDRRCMKAPELECYCGLQSTSDAYFRWRAAAMSTETDLIRELVDLLRYYRSRMHRVTESEDGGLSPWHTVYGVHMDAMKDADAAIQNAKDEGWAAMIVREYL